MRVRYEAPLTPPSSRDPRCRPRPGSPLSSSRRTEGFRGADHRGRYHLGLRSWSLLIPRNVSGSTI
ncbi:hypothetical protein BHE74_00003185 [Ensete ventricosum]|nr:hypothetical protein BHE74_00003185 [Ensete ventricosum]RZR76461.1 hypothetical protein BHM03_00001243 [Ensete ventricosum]